MDVRIVTKVGQTSQSIRKSMVSINSLEDVVELCHLLINIPTPVEVYAYIVFIPWVFYQQLELLISLFQVDASFSISSQLHFVV